MARKHGRPLTWFGAARKQPQSVASVYEAQAAVAFVDAICRCTHRVLLSAPAQKRQGVEQGHEL
eukprot:COSAG01_NODE_1734_length_9366_cov_4.124636_5_plen_64_part_00